jgi:hypothetical protein
MSLEDLWPKRAAKRDAASLLSVFVRPLWKADPTYAPPLRFYLT